MNKEYSAEKELAMLKALPVQKRLEILEERVLDLESLIIQLNTTLKSFNTNIHK